MRSKLCGAILALGAVSASCQSARAPALRAPAADAPGPGAGAPAMSRSAQKAALKQASAALRAGRYREALRSYEAVTAQSPPTESRRAEALYWVGLLRLFPGPDLRDLDRSRAALGELQAFFPDWDRKAEAALGLALSGEIVDLRSESDSLRSEMAKAAQNWAIEKDEISGRAASSAAEAKAAKAELEQARGEAETLREELKRKDEALRKVKEALVGWKPSR